MNRTKKSSRTVWGYLLSVTAFVCVTALFLAGVTLFSKKADAAGAETLRNGIRRASVQCYAIEGRYPPNVAYLEENYGIHIDREHYSVFYEGFASNIMPDITVIRLEP